jgi:hypothetical protein
VGPIRTEPAIRVGGREDPVAEEVGQLGEILKGSAHLGAGRTAAHAVGPSLIIQQRPISAAIRWLIAISLLCKCLLLFELLARRGRWWWRLVGLRVATDIEEGRLILVRNHRRLWSCGDNLRRRRWGDVWSVDGHLASGGGDVDGDGAAGILDVGERRIGICLGK